MNDTLTKTISKIIADINKDNFKNEQHVRSGIIYPILDNLGWDSKNKNEVFDEFSVIKNYDDDDQTKKTTRVDIALLDENNISQDKPLVFMELKAIDKLKKNEGEKQLYGYSIKMTPIISILTNGKVWYFYNNFESGNFSNKLFLTLNLCENDIDKIVNYLTMFLHKDNFDCANYKNSNCLKKIDEIKAKENKLSEIKEYLKQNLENINFDDADWQEIKNFCYVKTEKIIEQAPIKTYFGKRKLQKRGGEVSGQIYINENNEYVLLKGAIFAKEQVSYFKDTVTKETIQQREQCIKNLGSDCEINDEFTYKLNKNLTFTSASAAASFLVVAPVDGLKFFKYNKK